MKRYTETAKSAGIEATAARLVARCDAGLSPAEERELKNWLEADPLHRGAFEFYGTTWTRLGKPAARGTGAWLERHLEKLATRRRRRRRIAIGTVAAILMLAAVVEWGPRERSMESGASSALVFTPSTQTLPDGSFAELKDGSRIEVDFSGPSRRVTLLTGEAHFAVQKNPDRPFVVSAAGLDVRAVGTAFSVKRGETAIEVLVTHGNVALEKSSGSVPGAAVVVPKALATLDAGKLAIVEIAAPVATPEVSIIAPLELSQRLAWRSPRLEFTRTPLGEAVALINQHTSPAAPRLVIADPDVATMRVSGVFRADNIEAFVLLLEGAFEVNAEHAAGTISLRRAR